MDEFGNRKAPEFNPQIENKSTRELFFASENKTVNENVVAKENIEFDGKSLRKTDKTKSRNKAISVLTSSLVGVVGLVVAGMTNMVNIKFKAKFNDVEYRDGQIHYSINVKDMTEKENLTIYQSRDTIKLEPVSLVDEDGDGTITGAIDVDKEYIEKQFENKDNARVRYVLDLRGMVGLDVERLFDRYVVKIDKFTSNFEDVEGYCNCGVDGYYYYTMHFEDDGGLFTNFKAYIVDDFYESASEADKSKHISYCTFSDNLHEEQRIFVLDLQGSRGTLVIEYTKDGVEQPQKVTTPIEL